MQDELTWRQENRGGQNWIFAYDTKGRVIGGVTSAFDVNRIEKQWWAGLYDEKWAGAYVESEEAGMKYVWITYKLARRRDEDVEHSSRA